jgi:DMSO/TMAO reductase YedYZ molybdopterin-dependent catalytic subunit
MRRRRDDGIGLEELAQASRNHGMPLEALRYDLTPAGLHYLLIHYDIPAVDPEAWRLEIGGHVGRPLSLSLEDLRQRPAVTAPVTLECAGNGRTLYEDRPVSQPWLLEAVGTASWTGTPLASLLDEAGLDDDAVDVVFAGLDRGIEGGEERAFERSLPVAEARRDDVLVAYAMNGQPLLPQHGSPARLIVPGWYGMAHVKWLASIRAIPEPFDGYQHRAAYRFRGDEDDPGTPLDRIRPRALMIPPGIPTFPERERRLAAGPVTLEGRAWSGGGPVRRVEVSVDGGATWRDGDLGPDLGEHAWRRWSFRWGATRGEHELACRATDASGATQPDEAEFNTGGYVNNGIQRVRVTVTGPG